MGDASALGGSVTEGDGRRGDVVSASAAMALVALAALVAGWLYSGGRPVHASSAPLFAHWLPHAGWGTPFALAIAALVGWRGPAVAATLRWRYLLAATYTTAVAWTLALALVDGWQRGLAGRLTTRFEYLSEVASVTSVPDMLQSFSSRILDGSPDSWTTHVAGHPPGALLVFVGLDRIGLGGGAWAAVVCVLVGAVAAVAVPVALRALSDEPAARAAVPFVVLFPGAVWLGVSADAFFTGVTAAGLALLAVGLSRPSRVAALGAGVTLAAGIYLSYGLTLIAPLALVTVIVARRVRPLLWTAGGAVAVVAAFTVAGFWWFDGYQLVQQRYYQGLASRRPYAYWIWANLAALSLSAGPVAAAVLRRAVRELMSRIGPRSVRRPAGAALIDGPAGSALSDRPAGGVTDRPAASGLIDGPAGPRATARPGAPRMIRHATGWLSRRATAPAAVLLPLAAAVAVLAADLSGLSKAEVERIWLPFAVWFAAGAALLPSRDRRAWLAVQAAVALLVNHLFLTGW